MFYYNISAKYDPYIEKPTKPLHSPGIRVPIIVDKCNNTPLSGSRVSNYRRDCQPSQNWWIAIRGPNVGDPCVPPKHNVTTTNTKRIRDWYIDVWRMPANWHVSPNWLMMFQAASYILYAKCELISWGNGLRAKGVEKSFSLPEQCKKLF